MGGSASPPVVDVCLRVSCAVSLNKEMSCFRSLFNLCSKDYVALRILNLQYASLLGIRYSVQLSRDLVANFNVKNSSQELTVNSLPSSVISSHQLKAELSRVEKLSYRGRSGVSSTVLSLTSSQDSS